MKTFNLKYSEDNYEHSLRMMALFLGLLYNLYIFVHV